MLLQHASRPSHAADSETLTPIYQTDASTSGPSLHPDPTNENLGSALAYRLADNVTPTVVRAPVSAVLDEAGRIAARQRFVSPPPLSQFSNAAPEASASAMQTELPFIDDATRVLGIGWTAIYDLAKADDSARTIDMNYLVREPKIIAENENLDFQLVQASSGFWLFQEEFGSARFISTTFEDVIIRLQRDPIDFMDAQPLRRISIRDLDLSDPQVVDYFERREASMANTRRASDPPVPDVVGAGYFERSTWREASMANTRRASDARTVDWSEVAEMHPILRTNLHSSGMANASQIDWDALASEAVESEAVESEKSGEGGEEGEERRGE